MSNRIFVLASLLAMFVQGCSDDICTICERLEECDVISESDIDQCVDSFEDYGADDDVLSRCADCLDDNSCGQLAAGVCDDACNEML